MDSRPGGRSPANLVDVDRQLVLFVLLRLREDEVEVEDDVFLGAEKMFIFRIVCSTTTLKLIS